MLIKTHLAITLFFVLLFLPFTKYPLLFLAIAFFSTYLPDVDSPHSKLGHHWIFRPLQWFSNHRGFVHSFTFLILVTAGFVLFLPLLALPFFLGYCSHLIADTFTIEGINPFYPYKKICSGKIKTGGIFETGIFFSFLLIDLFFVALRIFSIF